VTNFGSSSINTDTSILTEAGKRWEGNIALSLASINNFGLIEIYETLLNRARAISIDSGYNDPSANNALLLATGYLNDLYVVLGNEAFADAAKLRFPGPGGERSRGRIGPLARPRRLCRARRSSCSGL
jgi:hypothetical protein